MLNERSEKSVLFDTSACLMNINVIWNVSIYIALKETFKGWGHKIDDGLVAAKTWITVAEEKKVAALQDFACQACWVRAPTTTKIMS